MRSSPLSKFWVKVSPNFSLPVPRPSPQESAQSASGTAFLVPSAAPSDFHPIGRRLQRKQSALLGLRRARGPPPEWFVNGGRGGGGAARNPASPTLLLATSAAPRRYSALLPWRAAADAGTRRPGLSRQERPRADRPRVQEPRRLGFRATGFPKRTRPALSSWGPIGLKLRTRRLTETWGRPSPG